MRLTFILRAGACAMLLGALCQFGVARAEERPLDAPRAQGLIGERFDGYAVVHDAKAPAAVQQLAEQINTERRKVYEAKAKAQSVPALEVGKVYATEILNKAPAGTWFQGADGSWTRK